MGKAGHVQTRPPEYGSSISASAQSSLCRFLSSVGLTIFTEDGRDYPEYADRWEIPIPATRREGRYVCDLERMHEISDRLRTRPELVTDRSGNPVGDIAADILDEGVAAAVKSRDASIVIDWW